MVFNEIFDGCACESPCQSIRRHVTSFEWPSYISATVSSNLAATLARVPHSHIHKITPPFMTWPGLRYPYQVRQQACQQRANALANWYLHKDRNLCVVRELVVGGDSLAPLLARNPTIAVGYPWERLDLYFLSLLKENFKYHQIRIRIYLDNQAIATHQSV